MKSKDNLLNFVVSKLKEFDEITLSEACTAILKLEAADHKKELKDIERKDLVMEYLNSKLDITENTIKNYNSVLPNFLSFTSPNISRESVIDYLKRKDKKWGLRTKRRNYIIIKNFLRYLFKLRYLDEDISKYIKIPKKVTISQYVPGDKEIGIFFTTINRIYNKASDRMNYYTIFFLYAKTGLRLRELINLNYEDLDFKNKKIDLNQTKNHDKVYVSIDKNLEHILLEYINKFEIKGGSLIRGKGGKRINKNVITNNLRRIVKEAGLPESFTTHAFRRYFIDKQRRSGTDIFLLKELARHKDINTTYGYCNVKEEERIKAMENIQIAV